MIKQNRMAITMRFSVCYLLWTAIVLKLDAFDVSF